MKTIDIDKYLTELTKGAANGEIVYAHGGCFCRVGDVKKENKPNTQTQGVDYLSDCFHKIMKKYDK